MRIVTTHNERDDTVWVTSTHCTAHQDVNWTTFAFHEWLLLSNHAFYFLTDISHPRQLLSSPNLVYPYWFLVSHTDRSTLWKSIRKLNHPFYRRNEGVIWEMFSTVILFWDGWEFVQMTFKCEKQVFVSFMISILLVLTCLSPFSVSYFLQIKNKDGKPHPTTLFRLSDL